MQNKAKNKPVFIAFLSGISLLLLLVCCSPLKKGRPINTASLSNVILKVDGMLRVNGFVWLSWPDAIVSALEELKGIEKAEYKIELEQFEISYDEKQVTVPQIIEKIREDGNQRGFSYNPQVVKKT